MYCNIYVHSCGSIVKKIELEEVDIYNIMCLYDKYKAEYGKEPLFAFDIMIGCS